MSRIQRRDTLIATGALLAASFAIGARQHARLRIEGKLMSFPTPKPHNSNPLLLHMKK